MDPLTDFALSVAAVGAVLGAVVVTFWLLVDED